MEAIRIPKVIEKDGEIYMKGVPCKKGQYVEMILLIESSTMPGISHLTASKLFYSGVIGLWKDHKNIEDSTIYARQLREQAQNRRGEK